MKQLSIIIPSRNEEFLARTIEDIIQNAEGDTEVIAVLDGQWANPPIPVHPMVKVLYFPQSIGQRAATNMGVRLSRSKYIMKVDAHCAFDKGFDVKMMNEMQDDWTMVPVMRNLHVFDWVCDTCGKRWYQGPTPTHCFSDYSAQQKNDSCNSTSFHRDMIWRPKPGPNSTSYRFDREPHFQYWGGYKERQVGDIADTFSLQGSCFMVTREKYWELDLCEESWGSWGQQGIEVAMKTWMSGGRVVCNKKTWYAHLFRTQGGDFVFPYPNEGKRLSLPKSRELLYTYRWPKKTRSFQSIIDHFAPVHDWDVTKGVVYYTDNKLDPKIAEACKNQLKQAVGDIPIVSVSLQPMNDLGYNVHLPLERGYLTMAKQILAGLETIDAKYVFFCEHDVLYHPSHFEFVPPRDDVYYYNTNVWKVRASDGHALRVDDCKQLSGLCANREFLITHYKERIRRIETEGFSRKMGFEPGSHGRKERVDDFKAERWESALPNVDIRHDGNLTSSRWSKDQFRNQVYTRGWTESDEVPGWGKIKFTNN